MIANTQESPVETRQIGDAILEKDRQYGSIRICDGRSNQPGA